MNRTTVLVTGATSGIGRATALYLASRGYRVLAAGRRIGALEDLRVEASRAGHPLEVVLLDITDDASIEKARQDVVAVTGGHGVDVLINNAGYGHVGPLAYVTDAELREQFDTNVFGTMAVTRAFLPEMKARGSGRILNVSSVGGKITFPLMAAYNATKYALESLSDGLRMELAPLGIQVVLIEPGLIRTHFGTVSKEIAGRYVGAGTEYEAIAARTGDMVAWTDAMSVEPVVIARAMEKAIAARRPRARYVAPFHGRAVLFFRALLPTWVMDAILKAGMGLRPAAIKVPATAAVAA